MKIVNLLIENSMKIKNCKLGIKPDGSNDDVSVPDIGY